MAGIKGQVHTKLKKSGRQQLWQTMRIKVKRFSVHDLAIASPAANMELARREVRHLNNHGLVREEGSAVQRCSRITAGKRFRLIHDTGPVAPTRCPHCGNPFKVAECKPPERE